MPSSYIAQHFAFCSLQPLFFCSAEETSCQSTSLVIVGYRKEYLWQASLATAVNMCACLCSSSVPWSKAGSPALLPGCRSQREWRFNSYRPGTLFSGVLKRRVGGTLLPCSRTCLWLPDWGGLCGSQKFVNYDSFLRSHCKTTIVDGYQVGLQQAIRSSIWGSVKTLFELYGFVNDSIWSSLKVCRNFNKYSEVHFNLDPLSSAVFIIKLFFADSSLCFLWSGTDSSTIVCLLFFFFMGASYKLCSRVAVSSWHRVPNGRSNKLWMVVWCTVEVFVCECTAHKIKNNSGWLWMALVFWAYIYI